MSGRYKLDELKHLQENLFLTPDDRLSLQYTDEASVRRSVAALARAYGWPIVREEVVIPGWGRVDLLLQTDESAAPHLIEFKVELRKPSLIRRAFQQIDGYGRWWHAEHRTHPHTYLSFCDGDAAATAAVARAYPMIQCWSVPVLMHRMPFPNHDPQLRLSMAEAEVRVTEKLLRFQRWTLDRLRAAVAEHEEKHRELTDLVGF